MTKELEARWQLLSLRLDCGEAITRTELTDLLVDSTMAIPEWMEHRETLSAIMRGTRTGRPRDEMGKLMAYTAFLGQVDALAATAPYGQRENVRKAECRRVGISFRTLERYAGGDRDDPSRWLRIALRAGYHILGPERFEATLRDYYTVDGSRQKIPLT